MATAESLQELIVLFDPAASTVVAELRMEEFDRLLSGDRLLDARAASTVRAAYVQVGTGLAVRAVVFFQITVDARGYVDPMFNVPLEYMAQQGGAGPDIGAGRISMACRSQCPVPWHSVNLWEPSGWDETHSAMEVQKAVWRNRLGLKVLPVAPDATAGGQAVRARRPQDAVQELDEALRRKSVQRQALEERLARQQRLAMEQLQAEEQMLALERLQALEQRHVEDQRLSVASGQAGRISTGPHSRHHRESVSRRDVYPRHPSPRRGDHEGAPAPAGRGFPGERDPAGYADQMRAEMQRQQQGYLEQISACRDEIQQLKASLRYEQERNRRLQQLLRGDL